MNCGIKIPPPAGQGEMGESGTVYLNNSEDKFNIAQPNINVFPSPDIHLKVYQIETIGEVETALSKVQAVIFQAPCGKGKTVMIAEIIRRQKRGYKPGWVCFKYKDKFGVWPRRLGGDPIPPGMETRAWIRREAVKYAQQSAAN